MRNILIILCSLSVAIIAFVLYQKEHFYPYWDDMLNTSWNNSSPTWKWKKLDKVENNKCKRP